MEEDSSAAALERLLDYLSVACLSEAPSLDGIASDRSHAYRSSAAFVLAHGRAFEHAPLPEGVVPGAPGECYRNAALLALEFPDLFTYVEGYAVEIVPVEHAWCVDRSGRCVDTTWTGAPLSERAYFGVAIEPGYLSAVLARQGRYGIVVAGRTPSRLVTGEDCAVGAVCNMKLKLPRLVVKHLRRIRKELGLHP